MNLPLYILDNFLRTKFIAIIKEDDVQNRKNKVQFLNKLTENWFYIV